MRSLWACGVSIAKPFATDGNKASNSTVDDLYIVAAPRARAPRSPRIDRAPLLLRTFQAKTSAINKQARHESLPSTHEYIVPWQVTLTCKPSHLQRGPSIGRGACLSHRVLFNHIPFRPSLKPAFETTDILTEDR